MIDAGVGYRFNPWLRLDGTLEYRGAGMRARFGLTDPASPAFHGPLDYGYAGRAYLSAIVGLMNVYADLGTYWGFTPFVGAGAGFADNRTSRFADHGLAYSLNGPVAAWGGSFPGGSRTSFAWALMAGVDFAVAPNLAMSSAIVIWTPALSRRPAGAAAPERPTHSAAPAAAAFR